MFRFQTFASPFFWKGSFLFTFGAIIHFKNVLVKVKKYIFQFSCLLLEIPLFTHVDLSLLFVLQVLQNILETETEYSKDLQSLLTNYLRALQSADKYDSFTPNIRIKPPLCSCCKPENYTNVSRASWGFWPCAFQAQQLWCGADSGKPGGDLHLPADAGPISGRVHQVGAPPTHTLQHCFSVRAGTSSVGPSVLQPCCWEERNVLQASLHKHVKCCASFHFVFSSGFQRASKGWGASSSTSCPRWRPCTRVTALTTRLQLMCSHSMGMLHFEVHLACIKGRIDCICVPCTFVY